MPRGQSASLIFRRELSSRHDTINFLSKKINPATRAELKRLRSKAGSFYSDEVIERINLYKREFLSGDYPAMEELADITLEPLIKHRAPLRYSKRQIDNNGGADFVNVNRPEDTPELLKGIYLEATKSLKELIKSQPLTSENIRQLWFEEELFWQDNPWSSSARDICKEQAKSSLTLEIEMDRDSYFWQGVIPSLKEGLTTHPLQAKEIVKAMSFHLFDNTHAGFKHWSRSPLEKGQGVSAYQYAQIFSQIITPNALNLSPWTREARMQMEEEIIKMLQSSTTPDRKALQRKSQEVMANVCIKEGMKISKDRTIGFWTTTFLTHDPRAKELKDQFKDDKRVVPESDLKSLFENYHAAPLASTPGRAGFRVMRDSFMIYLKGLK